jgi:hypothetical protein
MSKLAYERRLDPLAHLLAPLAGKPHFPAARHKRPNLLQVAGLCAVPTLLINRQHPVFPLQAHLA